MKALTTNNAIQTFSVQQLKLDFFGTSAVILLNYPGDYDGNNSEHKSFWEKNLIVPLRLQVFEKKNKKHEEGSLWKHFWEIFFSK